MFIPEIKVFPTPADIAEEAARRVIDVAQSTERFSFVLAGGSTPKALYELLATESYRDQIDWSRCRVYFGDERCVPPDHADSNFRMAKLALLSKVPIPGDNIYRIRGEINPNDAAIEYGKLLKEHFDNGGPDLVLLGMGDDGHTASLFPGTEALKETHHRCVANYVEKFKAWRVTLSAPFINRAENVIILAAGAGKAARLQEVLEGPQDPERLPIQLIRPASGKLTWLLDSAAAAM